MRISSNRQIKAIWSIMISLSFWKQNKFLYGTCRGTCPLSIFFSIFHVTAQYKTWNLKTSACCGWWRQKQLKSHIYKILFIYIKPVFCIRSHHIQIGIALSSLKSKSINAISSPSLQLKSYYQIFINTVWPPFRLYKSCPSEDDVCSLHTVFPLSELHSISKARGVKWS